MLKRLCILIMVVFFLMDGEIGADTKLPEWINKGSGTFNTYKGKVIRGVGVGNGKIEALANALVDISKWIEEKREFLIKADSALSKGTTGQYFGKIRVQSLIKDFDSYKDTSENHISLTSKIIFDNPPKLFVIQLFYEAEGGSSSYTNNLEVTGKNCNLQDIINELKSNGFGIETFENDDGNYFVKLELDPTKAKRYFDELEKEIEKIK